MAKRLLSLLLVLAVLAVLCLPAALADGWIMYVYTDNGKTLNVRSDPSTGNNIIGHLNFGDPVNVRMTTANGWSVIDWVSGIGQVAYVQSRFLVSTQPGIRPAPTPVPVTPTTPPADPAAAEALRILTDMNAEFASARKVSNPYTVIARPARASGWVNLRWAPSTETERIATCSQGKELIVIAELKNWYQVQDPSTGMIGFISARYVVRK